MANELTKEELVQSVNNRLEVIGKQETLFGEAIDLTQFKNLKDKQERKAKVLSKFNGEIFRSIINTKDLGGNKRLDKLERQTQTGNRDSVSNVIERADSFGKKTLNTLSTFSSVITMAYTNLLSKEGDKVIDIFAGHNSRCSDVLSLDRQYVGFDVHTYPLEMCKKYAEPFGKENYLLLKQSSENIPFAKNSFDFAITCPPYFSAEEYNKIYEEEVAEDLSSKGYEEFLRLYENCYKELFRVLKKGSFSVVVIGDVHKAGRLYTLGLDTINICRKAGFVLHDINILNRGSNIGGDLNPVLFLDKLKRFPTIHEWILIFKKV